MNVLLQEQERWLDKYANAQTTNEESKNRKVLLQAQERWLDKSANAQTTNEVAIEF